MKVKVEHLQGYTYQVVEQIEPEFDDDYTEVRFQGNLSDCESWIRLNREGLL